MSWAIELVVVVVAKTETDATNQRIHLHCGPHLPLQVLLRPLPDGRPRRPIPSGRLYLRPADQESNSGRTQDGRGRDQ